MLSIHTLTTPHPFESLMSKVTVGHLPDVGRGDEGLVGVSVGESVEFNLESTK